ncbi:hypothetical protein ACFZAV_19825 [Streptomyces sp. NPDC008343]
MSPRTVFAGGHCYRWRRGGSALIARTGAHAIASGPLPAGRAITS